MSQERDVCTGRVLSEGEKQVWQHEMLRQEDGDVLRGWLLRPHTQGSGRLFP
jgi:hypothetical protein